MITIPEPWENNKNISQKKRDFYQYYATMLEPWDGPAAILFSDADVMGAVLDRNGLRPSRYYITKDGRMILSSEVGVLPCAPDNILMKDRLRPGKMLLVDTVKGEVVDDEKLKEYYASREPYGEWIDRNLVRLKDLKIPNIKVPSYTGEELTRLQKVFGYKYEEIKEHDPAHGPGRCRAFRCHGYRHPAGCAQQPASPAVQLLQAAFRAGDEPAHRCHPRKGGHLHQRLHRRPRQPAGG